MNVASLDLCKELYKLSGWEDTDKNWYVVDGKNEVHCGHEFKIGKELVDFRTMGFLARAYDLGYLLRKIPNMTSLDRSQDDVWYCYHDDYTKKGHIRGGAAATPEDAACKLAIELWGQGELK